MTSDTAYQLLVHGRCFSPGTPASSTAKTGRLDIAEILLKVALSTIKSLTKHIHRTVLFDGVSHQHWHMSAIYKYT